MSKKYVVYLIEYMGDLFPPYYIGSTSLERFKSGYMGSISSRKYKDLYFKEVKENPHLFKRNILQYFETRKEALEYELHLHEKFNVVKNESFVNMSKASANGFFGMDVKGVNNPNFGNNWSDEQKQHLSIVKSDPEYKENVFRIHLIRYGKWFNNLEKRKQTNLERYGVVCVFQSKEIKEKIRQRCVDKYGTEWTTTPESIEKGKITRFERYGDYYNLEKAKQTNLEKYGVENVFQSEEIKEKIRQKNLERYGVENPAQNPTIMKKCIETRKKNDILYNRKYDGELNANAKLIHIYDENDILVFECKGTFKKICIDNKLPYGPLYNSYRRGGEKIFTKIHSKKHLKNLPDNKKFVGWYAKLVE